MVAGEQGFFPNPQITAYLLLFYGIKLVLRDVQQSDMQV
jgi:hypothetical protein